MRQRTKHCIQFTAVIVMWCFMIVMFMYTMGEAAVGNKCNWASDCDFNETCKAVPYADRDGSSYRGICVPKDW